MRSGGLLAFTAAFSIVAALAASAPAAPLELKQVAADSTWLAHIDVDAIRASSVAQNAWREAMEKHKDAEAKLAFVRGVLGMDPTKDIHGITLYGKQIGKPQGVIIVAGDFDPEWLKTLGAVLPNREDTTHGDYKIASWKHECRGHACKTSATLRGKEQIVLAGSVDDLKAALDVLDGEAAGMPADAPLAGNIPPGTALLMRAKEFDDADLHSKIPVLKQIESFRFVIGEHEGQSFVRKRVTFTDPSTASLALKAIEGRKAAAVLLCPDELDRKCIAAETPKLDGSTLTVLWSASADEAWQEIQKIEKLIAKHRAKHKEQEGERCCPFCQLGCAGDAKCPICGAAGKKKDAEEKATPEKKASSPEEDF